MLFSVPFFYPVACSFLLIPENCVHMKGISYNIFHDTGTKGAVKQCLTHNEIIHRGGHDKKELKSVKQQGMGMFIFKNWGAMTV